LRGGDGKKQTRAQLATRRQHLTSAPELSRRLQQNASKKRADKTPATPGNSRQLPRFTDQARPGGAHSAALRSMLERILAEQHENRMTADRPPASDL